MYVSLTFLKKSSLLPGPIKRSFSPHRSLASMKWSNLSWYRIVLSTLPNATNLKMRNGILLRVNWRDIFFYCRPVDITINILGARTSVNGSIVLLCLSSKKRAHVTGFGTRNVNFKSLHDSVHTLNLMACVHSIFLNVISARAISCKPTPIPFALLINHCFEGPVAVLKNVSIYERRGRYANNCP